MRTIISLTSIPPRFSYLSETLNSIVNQTADIEDIILYIPRKYKRFEYDLDDLPQVPSEIKICITDPQQKFYPLPESMQKRMLQLYFVTMIKFMIPIGRAY